LVLQVTGPILRSRLAIGCFQLEPIGDAEFRKAPIVCGDLLHPSMHAEHSMGMPARSEPRKQWTPSGVHQMAVQLLCAGLGVLDRRSRRASSSGGDPTTIGPKCSPRASNGSRPAPQPPFTLDLVAYFAEVFGDDA